MLGQKHTDEGTQGRGFSVSHSLYHREHIKVKEQILRKTNSLTYKIFNNFHVLKKYFITDIGQKELQNSVTLKNRKF